MIKSTLHTLRLNARILERIEHFMRDFLATDIGIFLLVVVTRESVETKPQSDQQTVPIDTLSENACTYSYIKSVVSAVLTWMVS
jgi:hypothetical protein